MADISSKFEEFVELCTDLLKGESIQFIALIRKRYDNCSERFRNSPEMEVLLESTITKLREDVKKKRTFILLKDFVTELKAWAVDRPNQSARKRRAEDPLQAVAKSARVEESMSDSSDMEGKLSRAIGNSISTKPCEFARSMNRRSESPAGTFRHLPADRPVESEPESSSHREKEPVKPVSCRKNSTNISVAHESDTKSEGSLSHASDDKLTSGSSQSKVHSSCEIVWESGDESKGDTEIQAESACDNADPKSSSRASRGSDQAQSDCESVSSESSGEVGENSNQAPSACETDTSKMTDGLKVSNYISATEDSVADTEDNNKDLHLISTAIGSVADATEPIAVDNEVIVSQNKLHQTSATNSGSSNEEIFPVSALTRSQSVDSEAEDFSSKITSADAKSAQDDMEGLCSKITSTTAKSGNGKAEEISSRVTSTNSQSLNRIVSKLKTKRAMFPDPVPSTSSEKGQSKTSKKSDHADSDHGTSEREEDDIAIVPLSYDPANDGSLELDTPMEEAAQEDEDEEVRLKPEETAGTTHSIEELEQRDLEREKELKHVKHVRRLERLLEQIRDKIEEVRDTELSLDDLEAEDSSYIFEDKLQKKFVKVWAKLCELKGQTTASGRPTERRFRYEGSRFPEINRKIERFVNKNKIFPDYHDIKGIVRKVNTRCKLNFSAQRINDVSREAFVDVGEALQRRRHEDFIATFESKQTMDFRTKRDPALYDPELMRKLNENRKVGKSKLEEVINKYTDLQYEREEKGEKDDSGSSDEEDSRDSAEEERGKRNIKGKRIAPKRKLDTRSSPENSEDEGKDSGDKNFADDIEVDLAEDYQRADGEPLSQDDLQNGHSDLDPIVSRGHSSSTSSRTSSLPQRHTVPSSEFGVGMQKTFSGRSNGIKRVELRGAQKETASSNRQGQNFMGALFPSKAKPSPSGDGLAMLGNNIPESSVSRNNLNVKANSGFAFEPGANVGARLNSSTVPTSHFASKSTANIAARWNDGAISGTGLNTAIRPGASNLSLNLNSAQTVRSNASTVLSPVKSVGKPSSTASQSPCKSSLDSVRSPNKGVFSQMLTLRHPFLTKANSTSPLKVAARKLRLPSSLLKRANGRGNVKKGGLCLPGRNKLLPSQTDKDACVVIPSSEEEEDGGKLQVKAERADALSTEGFSNSSKMLNRNCGRRVKTTPKKSRKDGDDGDVIVLSDSDS